LIQEKKIYLIWHLNVLTGFYNNNQSFLTVFLKKAKTKPYLKSAQNFFWIAKINL